MLWLSSEFFAALVLCLIFLYYYLHYKRKNENLWFNKVPGKPASIFFGNLLDFASGSSQFLTTLMQYKKDYGDITKIHDGPFSVALLVADQKFMEFILSSVKFIDKADQYTYFHNWLGTGLLTSSGAKWKKRRRMLTPSFHFSILETFIDIFDNVGDIFIKQLENEVGKKSVDIYPLVTLCTLDIICEAAMGISINAQEGGSSDYVSAVKTICAIIVDRVFSPFHSKMYPLTPNYYKEKKALKTLHDHTNAVIDKRMIAKMQNKKVSTNNKEEEEDGCGIKKRQAFLDLLLTYTMDGKPLSRSDIREEVDTFMFEGHDTTSSGISFTLFSIATNPKVQKKAYEEQKRIFGDDNMKNVKAKASDLQEMKYLDMIIKEGLRLYPSVPFIGRSLGEDLEWEGIIYPKGTNMMLFNFATQRDPKYFEDPEKFIPERWETIDGTNPYVYVPFSAGPRNCIGQKFAMLEMKSTISKVLRNFELRPAIPEHVLRLAPETILVSKNGIRISLERRI